MNRILAQNRAQSVVTFMIENGVDSARMVALGYGEKVPKTLDSTVFSKLPTKYKTMFKLDQVLTEKFIAPLKRTDNAKFEAANQLNRRTEFKVLRTDYVAGESAKKEGK